MPDPQPAEAHVLVRLHDLLLTHLMGKMSHHEQTEFIRKVIDQSQLKASFVVNGVKNAKEMMAIKAAKTGA